MQSKIQISCREICNYKEEKETSDIHPTWDNKIYIILTAIEKND